MSRRSWRSRSHLRSLRCSDRRVEQASVGSVAAPVFPSATGSQACR
jgi:hypothetical protein